MQSSSNCKVYEEITTGFSSCARPSWKPSLSAWPDKHSIDLFVRLSVCQCIKVPEVHSTCVCHSQSAGPVPACTHIWRHRQARIPFSLDANSRKTLLLPVISGVFVQVLAHPQVSRPSWESRVTLEEIIQNSQQCLEKFKLRFFDNVSATVRQCLLSI